MDGDPADQAAWAAIQDVTRDPAACLQATLASVDPGAAASPAIQQLRDGRVGLLITADLILAEAAASTAVAHPDLRVAIVDAPVTRVAPNLTALQFRHDQAGFLAGALAGLMTRTNQVGGVYGLETASIHDFRVGFENGVRTVNPVIAQDAAHRLLAAVEPAGARPFTDPDFGRRQALAQLARGADIIFAAGGETARQALVAAAGAGRWCIGAGEDAYRTVPLADACLLSSALTDVRAAVSAFLRDAARHRWPASGSVTFGLENGGAGLAPFHALDGQVPAAVRTRLASIRAQLLDGTLSTGAFAAG